MFGDDFFNEIEKAFFGGRGGIPSGLSRQSAVSRDNESYVSHLQVDYDKIDTDNGYFVVVSFVDRLHEGDLDVSIEDNFVDSDGTRFAASDEKILSITHRGRQNAFVKIKVLSKVAKRKMTYTFINGILEVKFA